MRSAVIRDRSFYKNMFSIAIPVTLQNLITSSLNMVDTVMIGALGSKAIAAVGISNQYFFLFTLFVYGLSSGGNVFIAQFWGRRDVENIRKTMGVILITGCLFSLLFSSIAILFPSVITKVFLKDPVVIQLAEDYLRVVGFSYIMTTISYAYGFGLRGIGQAKLPMIISAIALCINTGLNYVMIFGKFGFPALGVKGAAYATFIARVVEMGLMLWILYKGKSVIAGSIREMTGFSKNFLYRFFTVTMPVILHEGLWAGGVTMYLVAYGKMGTEALAAAQITTHTIKELFQVVGLGIGSACAVMVGNKIGEGKEDTAAEYANIFSMFAIISGIVLGIALYFSSPVISNLFDVSEATRQNIYNILIVLSVFMVVNMYSLVLIIGVLRGGGDTKFSFYLEFSCVWLVGVPLAFMGVLLFKLPIYWVVALVSIEEVVKSVIGYFRIRTGKWIRNVVQDMS